MRRFYYFLASLLSAFGLTFLSLFLKRSYEGIVGTECEKIATNPLGHCYEQLPAGGFPSSYLVDQGGVSVVGKLGPEDLFLLDMFLYNLMFYIITIAVLNFFVKKIRNSRNLGSS